MKRIKAACLYQTISFILDPSVPKEITIDKVKFEVANYKAKLNSNVQILKETHNDDGSVEIEVRKAVSGYSVGHYFN
jgi:hypothetical protein